MSRDSCGDCIAAAVAAAEGSSRRPGPGGGGGGGATGDEKPRTAPSAVPRRLPVAAGGDDGLKKPSELKTLDHPASGDAPATAASDWGAAFGEEEGEGSARGTRAPRGARGAGVGGSADTTATPDSPPAAPDSSSLLWSEACTEFAAVAASHVAS